MAGKPRTVGDCTRKDQKLLHLLRNHSILATQSPTVGGPKRSTLSTDQGWMQHVSPYVMWPSGNKLHQPTLHMVQNALCFPVGSHPHNVSLQPSSFWSDYKVLAAAASCFSPPFSGRTAVWALEICFPFRASNSLQAKAGSRSPESVAPHHPQVATSSPQERLLGSGHSLLNETKLNWIYKMQRILGGNGLSASYIKFSYHFVRLHFCAKYIHSSDFYAYCINIHVSPAI